MIKGMTAGMDKGLLTEGMSKGMKKGTIQGTIQGMILLPPRNFIFFVGSASIKLRIERSSSEPRESKGILRFRRSVRTPQLFPLRTPIGQKGTGTSGTMRKLHRKPTNPLGTIS